MHQPLLVHRGLLNLSKTKKHTCVHIQIFLLNTNKNTHTYVYIYTYWLVVSTPLKNMSHLRSLFPIYGKIKNGPNHQSVYIYMYIHYQHLNGGIQNGWFIMQNPSING